MIKSSIKKTLLFTTVFILLANFANAQVSEDSQLFKALKAKDSLMFQVGFNQCNLEQIAQLLPEKFEFYHDKDGIITSKTEFIQSLSENLCSSGKNIYKRVLKEGSLEVFPLHQQGELYGAIQTGSHYFGKTVAKFTHLWLIKDGEWEPFRMISYDHKTSDAPKIEVTFIELSSADLSFYLGRYRFSPDFILSIIIEGGKIYGDSQGEKAEIRPYGDHSFLDESGMMELRFTIGAGGDVTGLVMAGPDGEMIAEKIN